jgi:hypothetical protein
MGVNEWYIQFPNAFYTWIVTWRWPFGSKHVVTINVILTYIFYVLSFNFNLISVGGKADIYIVYYTHTQQDANNKGNKGDTYTSELQINFDYKSQVLDF